MAATALWRRLVQGHAGPTRLWHVSGTAGLATKAASAPKPSAAVTAAAAAAAAAATPRQQPTRLASTNKPEPAGSSSSAAAPRRSRPPPVAAKLAMADLPDNEDGFEDDDGGGDDDQAAPADLSVPGLFGVTPADMEAAVALWRDFGFTRAQAGVLAARLPLGSRLLPEDRCGGGVSLTALRARAPGTLTVL